VIEITREHPEYLLRQVHFQTFRDLYSGGVAHRNNTYRYLQRRRDEPADLYNERAGQAFYENYIGSIVDWYAASLFRREPLVTVEGQNESARRFYAEFTEDCDRRGSTVTDFLRTRFTDALIQGSSYILVDFPHLPEAPLSRAEEEAMGAGRAFLTGFTAENLINWSRDAAGNYDWVVLRQYVHRKEKVTDADWTLETRWFYFDRQHYRFYRTRKGDVRPDSIELYAQGFHAMAKLGRVPLFDLTLPDGLWLVNKASSLQLEYFNKSNALSWAMTMGLFAMPVIYSDVEKDVKVGEAYYVRLGAHDRFGWTEPEGKVYTIASANLERLQQEIYRVCYVLSQAGGPASGNPQSGLSKLRDYAVTIEVLRGYGDLVKDCLKRILNSIEAAREDGVQLDVSGLDEFDVKDFASELDEAERLLKLGIESSTLKKQVFKKLALKYLCDTRQELKDRIATEIDQAA
jgi:hypothetical protein